MRGTTLARAAARHWRTAPLKELRGGVTKFTSVDVCIEIGRHPVLDAPGCATWSDHGQTFRTFWKVEDLATVIHTSGIGLGGPKATEAKAIP